MDHQHGSTKPADPDLPHGFVERMNVPFAVPRATGGVAGIAAPEYAFRGGGQSDECAVCRKVRSDHIHEASEREADPERWPV